MYNTATIKSLCHTLSFLVSVIKSSENSNYGRNTLLQLTDQACDSHVISRSGFQEEWMPTACSLHLGSPESWSGNGATHSGLTLVCQVTVTTVLSSMLSSQSSLCDAFFHRCLCEGCVKLTHTANLDSSLPMGRWGIRWYEPLINI